MNSIAKSFILIFFVAFGQRFCLQASSSISVQQICNTIDSYYQNIQVFADETGKVKSLDARDNIKRLFLDSNSVLNDLNPFNSGLPIIEDDVENYLLVINNLAGKFHYRMLFSYEIDRTSVIEMNDIEDDQIKSAGAGEPLYWITVNKKISFLEHPENTFSRRETFKFKGSLIERICSPEQSTAIINGLKYYRQGDYDKAYETFLNQIELNRADEDTYWYLGLMLRKHKISYYSNKVSDKLCIFYWNKCFRGSLALKHLGVDYVRTHSKKTKAPFNDGLMVVYKGDKYGYMDKSGKMVIPYSYSDAWDFSDGFALVKSAHGYGYIDPNGHEVIPCQYLYAFSFTGGYAVVNKNGWLGVINVNEDIIIPFKYKFIKYYQSEGYFLVSTDKVNYYELKIK